MSLYSFVGKEEFAGTNGLFLLVQEVKKLGAKEWKVKRVFLT